MNRHHIKAVMYKQFCDTLKNKLLRPFQVLCKLQKLI